ncbi:MAG TPA: hypothetical protein DEB46_08640 [Myxococcales bacterium]|nr:hypothetical protein [Myxococcales bacterium]
MVRLTFSLCFCAAIACVPNPGADPGGGGEEDAGPAANQPVCGDGVREGSEECDDGNRRNGDGCTSRCRIQAEPACGDGNVDRLEECDDGNTDPTDGCTDECFNAKCGDGITRSDLSPGAEGYEACDDGNEANDDSCLGNCQAATCGDGVRRTDLEAGVEGYESCDDSNEATGDGCAACACEDLDIDHGADAAGATAVELGAETPGILACGDVDYFQVTVADAGEYRFYTDSSIDTLCLLFDSMGEAINGDDGEQIGDDDSGRGYNCWIRRDMEAGETVIVGVRHFAAEAGTGAYTFVAKDLRDDHGNDAANASPITTEAMVSGEIELPGDVDVFSFVAATGEMMEFGTEASMDPMCELRSADGAELLGENDDVDAQGQDYNCLIPFEVEADTTYTFWIRHYERNPNQPGNTGLYEAFVRPAGE